jgi:REP element-mobilizing transposase RayT
LYDHGKKFDLIFAVVMPDHVHLILVPVINMQTREVYSLAGITDAIKGASAHKVNQALGRTGRVWQAESFDHVVRSSESLDQKIEYLRENPLRQGLARKWQGYRWIWQNPLVTSPR